MDTIIGLMDKAASYEETLSRAVTGDISANAFLINLSYGAQVFTPRNEHFLQAMNFYTLPFGKRSISPIPNKEKFYIKGPAPLPAEFRAHVRDYLKTQKNPKIVKIYREILNNSQN